MDNIQQITFNDMPNALAYLIGKVEKMETLLCAQSTTADEPTERWLNLQELCDYLPDKPAKQTVYGWICHHNIPYHKKGKKLQFSKSEIDAWLKTDKCKSNDELYAEALQFVNSKKRGVL